MASAQPRIYLIEEHSYTSIVFWQTRVHLISASRPNLIKINPKKRTCKIVGLAVLADPRIKLKESEKKNKYLDLAWELKKKLQEI